MADPILRFLVALYQAEAIETGTTVPRDFFARAAGGCSSIVGNFSIDFVAKTTAVVKLPGNGLHFRFFKALPCLFFRR